MVHGIFDDIFSCWIHLLIPVRFSFLFILKRQQQSSKIFVQQRQMVEDVRRSKSVRCKFKRLKCVFRPRFFNNLVQLSQWVSVEKREKKSNRYLLCVLFLECSHTPKLLSLVEVLPASDRENLFEANNSPACSGLSLWIQDGARLNRITFLDWTPRLGC